MDLIILSALAVQCSYEVVSQMSTCLDPWWLAHCLDQSCPTGGPRAASGPRGELIRPAKQSQTFIRLLKCYRLYSNKRVFVRLKCENSHMKQPKLMSPDAISVLEVCQNALSRRGSAPGPTAEAYILWAVSCQVVKVLLCCCPGSLSPNFSSKQQDHGLFSTPPWPS